MPRFHEAGYEQSRVQALRSYRILDSLTETEYENVTFIASVICNVPIAVISFVDEKRQWFKSIKGLESTETPRDYSFCAHAINSDDDVMIVPDSREDDRFKNNPLVTGDPKIVFYAGVPLVNEEGYGLGTVCVIDNKPRELTADQLKALQMLSTQVMKMLETRKLIQVLESITRDLESN